MLYFEISSFKILTVTLLLIVNTCHPTFLVALCILENLFNYNMSRIFHDRYLFIVSVRFYEAVACLICFSFISYKYVSLMHDEKKWTTLFENLYFFLIMFKNDWYHFKLHINIQWNYFNFKGQIFEIFAMFGHYFMGFVLLEKRRLFCKQMSIHIYTWGWGV